MWKSAAGLSALAAALTAVVSAVALVAGLGGDSGGSTPPTSATTPPSTQPEPSGSPSPATDRVIYEDSMADRSAGWATANGPDCYLSFTPSGFEIRVDAGNLDFCSAQTTFSPDLVSLANVRIEVDVEWADVPERALEDQGHGGAGLRCRGVGSAFSGSFYSATISDTGSWRIDKWEGGQSESDPDEAGTRLATGRYPPGSWNEGETAHLALQCSERDEAVIITFSVDGRIVAAAKDPAPLPAGDVGLIAFEFLDPVAVEFRNLVVIEPA